MGEDKITGRAGVFFTNVNSFSKFQRGWGKQAVKSIAIYKLQGRAVNLNYTNDEIRLLIYLN